MILVSVGTQLPFDRLIKAVDDWAANRSRDDIVAQIGPSDYQPRAIRAFSFLNHEEFFRLQSNCSLMVSHAGMGSIITALDLGKPIVILARDHRRHEHRNGHQLDILDQFRDFPGVYIARDEIHLADILDQCDSLVASQHPGSEDVAGLIEGLTEFVQAPPRRSLLRRIASRFQPRA